MVATRVFTISAFAAFACFAAANPSVQEIRNLLVARQDDDGDDSADYQCHADCGYTIVDSQDSTPSAYCSNQTWVDQLNRCLACTNQEDDDDIWEDYGSSVSSAAEACGGQTATPGAVLSTASAAASATGTATEVVTTITGTASSSGTATAPTSVTDCHSHGDDLYCVADGAEWEVTSDINADNAPDSFDNCRPSGDDDLTCVAADGSEVELEREGADHTGDDHDHSSSTTSPTGTSTPSPANTSAAAGGASASPSASETATQDGSAGRVGTASMGGVAGLVLAILAL